MPGMRTLIQMALVQLGTIFLLNSLAGAVPATRRLLKGNGNGSAPLTGGLGS